MSILSKLFTLFRGVAHESGQKAVDANALTILDQEIRDTSTELNRAREELTKLMAQSKLAQQKLDARAGKRAELESYIESALSKGNEDLAREIAVRLAALESEDKGELATKTTLDNSINTLKTTIKKAEQQLHGLRQQVDTVKATASVQRAQMAVASRTAGGNSKMGSALESLERIKARQAETAARLEASEELESETGDNELQRKLAAAGITSPEGNADAVLARFRKPAELPPPTLQGRLLTAEEKQLQQ